MILKNIKRPSRSLKENHANSPKHSLLLSNFWDRKFQMFWDGLTFKTFIPRYEPVPSPFTCCASTFKKEINSTHQKPTNPTWIGALIHGNLCFEREIILETFQTETISSAD